MNNVAKNCLLVAAPPVSDARVREIGTAAYKGTNVATPLEVASLCGELVDARTAQRIADELDARERKSGVQRLLTLLIGGLLVIGCGGTVDPLPAPDAAADVVDLDTATDVTDAAVCPPVVHGCCLVAGDVACINGSPYFCNVDFRWAVDYVPDAAAVCIVDGGDQ